MTEQDKKLLESLNDDDWVYFNTNGRDSKSNIKKMKKKNLILLDKILSEVGDSLREADRKLIEGIGQEAYDNLLKDD